MAKASLYANFNGKDDLVRAYLDARFEARRAAIEMSRPRTRARHVRWRRQLHRRRHTDREADDDIFGVGLDNDCQRATFRPGNPNLPGFPFKELRNDDLAVDRVSAIFPRRRGPHNAGIQLRIPRHEFLDATWEQIIAINLASSFYGSQPASIHPGRAGRLRGE